MAVLAPHPDAAKVADKVLAGTGAVSWLVSTWYAAQADSDEIDGM